MDIIKEDVFKRQLKNGLTGGYLFFGDEDYLKVYYLNSARNAVCPDKSFAFFNDMRIDALDYTASALLEALIPVPMMSDKKIVTVSGLAISNMRPSEIDDLCDVLAALPEYDYNVLIISVPAGLIDEGYLPKRPSAVLTKLGKYLKPVRFEATTPARLCNWAIKHFEHNGVSASSEVCDFLINYCGTSMFILSSEIDKLSFYALSQNRTEIRKDDILFVSVPSVDTDAYAFTNAILDGKYDEALNVLSVMKYRRVEPVFLLSEISRVICDLISVRALSDSGKSSAEIAGILKMNEYKAKIYTASASGKPMEKLRRAVELCSEADASLKMSPQGYTALEKLICSF